MAGWAGTNYSENVDYDCFYQKGYFVRNCENMTENIDSTCAMRHLFERAMERRGPLGSKFIDCVTGLLNMYVASSLPGAYSPPLGRLISS